MLNTCKDCAFFVACTSKKEVDACYAVPGKRYVVWGERPACAYFKGKKEAELEFERRKIKEELEEK